MTRLPTKLATAVKAAAPALAASVLLAGAAATPASADGSAGGWYMDNHWTYTEILANKRMTALVADHRREACLVLGLVSRPAGLFCGVYSWWWGSTARDARSSGRCFRLVLPAHKLDWSYPSTYRGSWCR